MKRGGVKGGGDVSFCRGDGTEEGEGGGRRDSCKGR